jgi:hypothetical protein
MLKQGLLLSLIVILVLTATAAGIFHQTSSPNVEGTSPRGQHVTYQGSGVYRYNPTYSVREGVIWDCVNLFAGLPLFVLAAAFALRGSLRARLFLGGLLAYYWYVFLGTVMMNAFNNLFLVYVAILPLTMVAFVLNINQVDLQRLPARFSARFPRRAFIGFFFLLAFVLVGLWLSRVLQVMKTGLLPAEYAGMLTLGSQALDLGLVVPLAVAAGVLLIRESTWGYVLASVCMPFGLMMFISIPLWATVPLIQDGQTNMAEAIPFYSVSAIGIALALVFFLSVQNFRGASVRIKRESA